MTFQLIVQTDICLPTQTVTAHCRCCCFGI